MIVAERSTTEMAIKIDKSSTCLRQLPYNHINRVVRDAILVLDYHLAVRSNWYRIQEDFYPFTQYSDWTTIEYAGHANVRGIKTSQAPLAAYLRYSTSGSFRSSHEALRTNGDTWFIFERVAE